MLLRAKKVPSRVGLRSFSFMQGLSNHMDYLGEDNSSSTRISDRKPLKVSHWKFLQLVGDYVANNGEGTGTGGFLDRWVWLSPSCSIHWLTYIYTGLYWLTQHWLTYIYTDIYTGLYWLTTNLSLNLSGQCCRQAWRRAQLFAHRH